MKVLKGRKAIVVLGSISVLSGIFLFELNTYRLTRNPDWIAEVFNWQEDEVSVGFASPRTIADVSERCVDEDSDGLWDVCRIQIYRWPDLYALYRLDFDDNESMSLSGFQPCNDSTSVFPFDDDGDSIADRVGISLGGFDGLPTRWLYSDYGIDGVFDKVAYYEHGKKMLEFVIWDDKWHSVIDNPPDALYGETTVKVYDDANPQGIERTVVFRDDQWHFLD